MESSFEFLVAILVIGYANCRGLQEPVQLSQPYQVQPYRIIRSLYNNISVVPGYRDCGKSGSGRLLSYHFELCDGNSPPPCKIPANANGRSEVLLISSEDIKGLGVRTTVTTLDDGDEKVYETPLPNFSIPAGQEYVISHAGAATSELKGRQFTYKQEFYRLKDKHVEVCSEGDYLAE